MTKFEEMDAKGMFDELGFSERIESNSIMNIKSFINYKTLQIIYFDYDKKIDIGNTILSIELLQAINKQCEELGWK